MNWIYRLVIIVVFFGCASDWQLEDTATDLLSDPTHPHWTHDLDDGTQKNNNSIDCSSRWIVDEHAARAQRVSFNGVGDRCLDGPQDGARTLGDSIRTRFGQHINQRILGRGVQIFNCRKVQGSRSLSIHAEGRALDIFIPTRGGKADNSKGDVIANWLIKNASQIGIQQIIWDRTIWNSRENQASCYKKRHPHHDHIHLELNWAGAQKQTPFFYGGHDNQSRIPAPAPQARPDEPAPNPDPVDDRPPVSGAQPSQPAASDSNGPDSNPDANEPDPSRQPQMDAADWLGSPCLADSDCGFTVSGLTPSCVKPIGSQLGMCTLSCDGLCPDRNGFPMTFCTEATDLGLPGIGLCLAQADTENGQCNDWIGFAIESHQRFIGQSQANARTTGVCVPYDRDGSNAGDGHSEPALDDNNGMCAEPALPMTRHGESCDGVIENTWRCGCSRRFETTISQFCREGIWQTYDLNPRDCSRCSGDYSSGCEPR